MTAPVFVVGAGDLDGLGPGDRWTLTGPEARHAATVQRLRSGEPIAVVDGAGVRMSGLVTDGLVTDGSNASAVVVEVVDVTREEPPSPRLVLVQALAKGGRDEMAVEAATEVGVDAVRPWQSARSVVQWRGEKARRGEERWRALVHAATKVARRSRLPEVLGFVRGDQVVPVVEEAVRSGAVVLVLHEVADALMTGVDLPGAPEVMVVVGPEGGITDEEVAALVAVGARAVLLGPNVLRSSTAGPAALAVLSALTRRW